MILDSSNEERVQSRRYMYLIVLWLSLLRNTYVHSYRMQSHAQLAHLRSGFGDRPRDTRGETKVACVVVHPPI